MTSGNRLTAEIEPDARAGAHRGNPAAAPQIITRRLGSSRSELMKIVPPRWLHFAEAASAIEGFVWDGTWPLMHLSGPAAISALYFLMCAAHNMRRERRPLASARTLNALAALHNGLLALFSAVACAAGTYHFVALLQSGGLHNFLCSPLPPASPKARAGAWAAPPLAGPLHGWCYIFYLSKYWELLDTVLLISRGKRVLFLHAFHHALLPPLMAAFFQGRVSVSLVALTVINAFVHLVMYSYFTLSALEMRPSEAWKKQITRLQILQFSLGVLGGSYYWARHLRSVRVLPLGSWPPLRFRPGCDGGDDLVVLSGYMGNLSLLFLFCRFYVKTYLAPRQGKPAAGTESQGAASRAAGVGSARGSPLAGDGEARFVFGRAAEVLGGGSAGIQEGGSEVVCDVPQADAETEEENVQVQQTATSAGGQLIGLTPGEAEMAALLDVPLDAMAESQPPLARLARAGRRIAVALLLPPGLVIGTPILLTTALLAAPVLLCAAAAAAPALLAYAYLFDIALLSRLRAHVSALVTRGCRLPTLLAGAPRDIAFLVKLVSATRQLNRRLYSSRGGYTTADYWRETVQKHGPKPALVFEGAEWSYSDLDAISARVGAWARLDAKLAPREMVALLSSNRPEHLMAWLGLARVHVPVALLHTALRGASLRHALAQCDVRTVIFEASTADALAAINGTGGRPAATNSTAPADGRRCYQLFTLGGVGSAAPAPPQWALPMRLPVAAPEGWDATPTSPEPRSTDPLVLIYTSGTTGMPKAAKLTHVRFFSAIVLTYMFGLTAEDKLYCCLPMCHTAAFGAFSLCWWAGIPLVLARGFSASRFWKDVSSTRCTLIQYVGELCRFLLHAPPSTADTSHAVRLAFGNGMRPDVWPRFVARFGVPRIGELYASTEGNANLANTENEPGAVGFISPLLAPLYPVKLVRLAQGEAAAAGGELLRRPDGLCVECLPGEAGELLGKVDQRDASRNFAGYTDRAATARRLVRHVARRGDAWFRTGDLLRADERGFVFFVDRMGDTFRYRGENVSTAEVEAVLGTIAALRSAHASVYGVSLPGVDGRVGMASVVQEPGAPAPDFRAVFTALQAELPAHAHPRFLRLLRPPAGADVESAPLHGALEATLTFKVKKAALAARGIAPGDELEAEEMYMRDAGEGTYVRLTPSMRAELLEGRRRLE